ncbi:MAG: hypothetical protein ABIQ99_11500 [Thermoflexales bacterium]
MSASPTICTGQPPSRMRADTRSRVGPSVTLTSSPSRTMSIVASRMAIEQAGFAVRLRFFRFSGPLEN